MSHPNEELIKSFYTAFDRKDYKTMQQSYSDDAHFSDPVFQNLTVGEAKAMWQMLITSAKDLRISVTDIKADESSGSCRWDAYYTFSTTGRKVHNIIHASFQFRNGKIAKHVDRFDFYRWTRMALGTSGLLLGWSPLIQNAVRKKAMGNLKKFMTNA
jgi:ketosteroid isomerase-like protein